MVQNLANNGREWTNTLNSFAMLCPHFQPHPGKSGHYKQQQTKAKTGGSKTNVYQLGESRLQGALTILPRGCSRLLAIRAWGVGSNMVAPWSLWCFIHLLPIAIQDLTFEIWHQIWKKRTPYWKQGTKRFQGFIFQDVNMDVRILAW